MRTSIRLAIMAFLFSLTSCGAATGVQEPSCTADEPDEFGNVVNWCDDGSHWWIDSDTGARYDTDASGNTTTSTSAATSTGGVQEPSCTADEPDEFGNVVNWCDDGSHWWIDPDTGARYDTDSSGNTTTTKTID